jgi:hypothetical protein
MPVPEGPPETAVPAADEVVAAADELAGVPDEPVAVADELVVLAEELVVVDTASCPKTDCDPMQKRKVAITRNPA